MAQPTDSLAVDETDRLIASDKVEGTAVYDRRGERLGTIRNLMLDKRTGQVAYAVMASDRLGSERRYPLPWKALAYDTQQGGYVVDLDEKQLEQAPSYAGHETPDWHDRDWGVRIYDYYKVEAYWGV